MLLVNDKVHISKFSRLKSLCYLFETYRAEKFDLALNFCTFKIV